MITKGVCIAAMLAIVAARPQEHHGEHGHAYSSQSFVLHQVPHHEPAHKPAPVHHQPAPVHHQPAPVYHQPAPVYHQPAPVYHQPAPVYHQPAPVHHQPAPVHHQPAQKSHQEHHEEYYAHPKYEYEYKVEDPHTGDNKFHHETRDGDVVKGVYSLHEADGTIRIVEYTADKHNGFQAIVKRQGHPKQIVSKHHH